MELKELFEKYSNCTDEMEAFVLLSMIIEKAGEVKDGIKEVLEDGELGSTLFKELGKSLDLIEMKKATLDNEKIKEQLSDEECRKGLKVTEKMVKDLGRKDLLTDEYKSVTITRQLRVTTLKETA